MVTIRRRGRAGLCAALLAVLALLLLDGCVTVHGTGVRRSSSDSAGLARPFLPLPAITLTAVPDGYDPGADASGAVADALAAARADGRPVLLDFGSAWCEDCTALSTLVDRLGVHRLLARNYHLVTVDVGHYDRNSALAARYVDLAHSGIPALVVLNPDGSARDTGDMTQFANARSLTGDQFGDLLVDWLYATP